MQRHTIPYLKSKFTPYISSDLSSLFVLEHNIGCRPKLRILLEKKKECTKKRQPNGHPE